MNEKQKRLHEIVAQAWLDNAFLQRLVQDPQQCLMNAGISVAAVTVVLVTCGTPKVMAHENGDVEFEIPPAPEKIENFELSLIPFLPPDKTCCC